MKSRKSQAALEFIMTYGWAILVVLVAVGWALIGFGVLSPCKFYPEDSDYFQQNCPIINPQEDVVDSEPELQEICNKLVVNNEVYPFLEVMGRGLKNANNAQFVIYKLPAELRSNLDIFNVDGLILCGVPAELCFNEGDDVEGGTYCLLMRLEVPVKFLDYIEWYQNKLPMR